jgi:hypothetical protein
MSEETRLLEQALDSNSTLEDEIKRLRKTVTMLRGVNGALRRANDSLRRQAELAVQNDELFKQICDTGFGATVTEETGGLPGSSAVESTVANVEEAS